MVINAQPLKLITPPPMLKFKLKGGLN